MIITQAHPRPKGWESDPAKSQAAQKLWAAGKGFAQIAAAIGVSSNVVPPGLRAIGIDARKKCVVCGSPFKARGSTITCSPTCAKTNLRNLWVKKARRRRENPELSDHDKAVRRANERGRVKRRERRRPQRGVGHCAVCGRPFRPRAKKILCSRLACRKGWLKRHRSAENGRRAAGLRCPICKVWYCPIGRGRRKTCSDQCAQELRRRYVAKRNVEKKEHIRELIRKITSRKQTVKAIAEAAELSEILTKRLDDK